MYLLLRDNKQSGPYSLDELKVKGLKAYDLVWVEGRSAAWRYPSEIEELSAFAPIVEEQPFDRFFKKPAAAGQGSTVSQGSPLGQTGPVSQGSPLGQAGPALEIPSGATAVTITQPATSSNPATTKRTIYVTMPGGIAAREASPVSPAREMVREVQPVQPAREVAREITPARESTPVRSYRQEPATEILPPLPGRKPVNLWMPVAIGGSVLVLLAAGIFIGLSIQKNSSGSLRMASKGQPVLQTTAQQLPVSPATGTTTGAGNVGTGNVGTGNIGAGNAKPAAAATAPSTTTDKPVVRKPRITAPKQKAEAAKTQAAVPPVTDSSAVQPADQHREAIHRTDALPTVDNHESLKLALANQVSVGANKYEVGTFGGIRHLQVTVTNRSAYSLDLVVVAVSYIQANKKTYKTENLYFRGIAPGSALMLEAPKSSRGIHVEYKITSINTKELGLSEPGT